MGVPLPGGPRTAIAPPTDGFHIHRMTAPGIVTRDQARLLGGDPAILDGPYLLDDRSAPSFRRVFGRLLLRADTVQVAVSRIRLSGIDLSAEEVERLRLVQLVTSEVNLHRLGLEAESLAHDPERRLDLEVMKRLIRTGRLRARSAPLGGWAPDFSVFSSDGDAFALLVGPHWFERPFLYRGPSFGSLHGRRGAERAVAWFGELWREAHDLEGPVRQVIRRARRNGPLGQNHALDTFEGAG